MNYRDYYIIIKVYFSEKAKKSGQTWPTPSVKKLRQFAMPKTSEHPPFLVNSYNYYALHTHDKSVLKH